MYQYYSLSFFTRVSTDGRYSGNISGGVCGTSNNSGGGVDSGGAGPSYIF